MAENKQWVSADIPSEAGGVYFNVKDDETGKTNKVPYGESIKYGLDASHLSADSVPLYRSGTNGLSTKQSNATRVYLDKGTGEMVVKGKKEVVNNQDFQNRLKEELDALSQAYRINPNAQLPVLGENNEATGETITVEERIAQLNTPVEQTKSDGTKVKTSPLQAIADYYDNLNILSERLGKQFKAINEEGKIIPIEFNEEALTRLNQDGIGEGVKETDRISLPRNMKELEAAYKASTWDEETATIEIKDFRENIYNLDKLGEDKIQDMASSLERYLAQLIGNPTPTENVDVEQITGALALYNYIRKESPAANFWTGASYALSAPIKGILGYTSDLGQLIPTGAGFMVDTLMGVMRWVDQTFTGESDIPDWHLASTFYNALEEGQETVGAWIKYVGTSDSLEKAVASMNKDLKDQIAQLEAVSTQLVGEGKFSMNSTADAIEAISYGLTELFTIISIGNIFEAAGKGALASASSAFTTQAQTILATGPTTAQLTTAAKTLVNLLGAENTATLYNFLAKLANNKIVTGTMALIMETIGEAIVQDPDKLSTILADGKLLDSDGLSYLWESFYGNTMGLAVAKGAMAIGNTVPGKIVTTAIRKRVYKLQTSIADAFDTMRVKWGKYASVNEWIEQAYNPKTQQTMKFNRLIREKRKEIANLDGIKVFGNDYEGIKKALKEVEDLTSEMMNLENALDDYSRGSRLQIKEWQYSDDNPLFKQTNEALTQLTGKIMSAEKAAGLKSAAKVGAGRLFSKETTNYIGASVRSPILQNVLTTLKEGTKEYKLVTDEIAHWTKFMAEYQSKATPELLELVQDYTTNYKKWWNQANDIFMKAGLLDPDDIAAWRESGQWGTNGELYARLQRQTEMDTYRVMRADGKVDTKLSRDLGHYGFGNTDDFVDPQLVMQQELRINADISRRNEIIRAFEGAKGPTVVETAEHTAIRNEVAPKLKSYNKEAKQSIKSVTDALDTEGFFAEALSKQVLAGEVESLTRANRAIANTQIPSGPLTAAEQQTVVTVLPDSQIDTLFGLVTNNASNDDLVLELKAGKWKNKVPDDVRAELNRLAQAGDLPNNRATISNLQYALNSNEDLASSVKRTYLSTDPRVADEPYIQNLVQDSRNSATLDAMYEAYNGNLEDLTLYGLRKEASDIAMGEISARVIDDFGETFYAKNTAAKAISQDIASRYAPDAPEMVERYMMLDAMKHNKKMITDEIGKRARSYFDKVEINGKKLTGSQSSRYATELSKRISTEIDLEFNYARAALSEYGGDAKALIDNKSWQREIRDEAERVGATLEANNTLMMRNKEGKFEVVEIDPLLASFVGTKPLGSTMSKLEKVNYLWMRLFRMGTTGISPTSMVNQYWRDMGNAWILGNVNQTLNNSERVVASVFGEDVASALSQYSEEAQENFLRIAKESGRSVEDVLASSERARGKLVAEAGTETEAMRLYRETRDMWYKDGDVRNTVFDKANNAIDKITDKLGHLNEVRETYLRQLVYGNNYARALKEGKSIEQARIYAEYLANNATTNFTRQTTFLANLQGSIPYLRSAINGTKSFWRLWSLDPVGVTGRIIGGFVIPTIALTTSSMNGEENLKTYRNIPEYRKENALPVVVNGEYFSIPIPQELSAFINPVRHAIEAYHGLHDNQGGELILNDILAFSPLDLGGFTDIDTINLFSDQQGISWTERFSSGTTKLLAQILPKYLSAGVAAISGRDLYTGKKIDTSFVTVDNETGEAIVMDYTSGALATLIHDIFPNAAAPVVQEVLDTLFGDASVDYLDWLVKVGSGVVDRIGGNEGAFGEALSEAIETWVGTITKVNRPFIQDEVDRAWRGAIRDLWNAKKALLMGEEWQAYIKNKSNAVTQTQIDAAATSRANIINPFYDQVKTVVNNLINTYGGTLTSSRYASVISLMNMYVPTSSGNSAIDAASQELKQQSKNAAISTMVNLGFPSYSNDTIWGQVKSSSTGGTYVEYATPLQILDMKNTRYSQGAIYAADLKNLLDDNYITRDAYNEAWEKYNAAQSKEEKRQVAVDWDSRVAIAIAPYVQQYGANAITSSSDVIDLLDGYLMIPNDYTRYKGKSTYNPRNNITRGYSKQFLKDIFGAK